MIEFWDHEADVAALRTITAEESDAVFAPPPEYTVSQWADEHRRLSSVSSAEPGRYRTDRVPYLRMIQDVLGDDIVQEVVCAKSAQIGLSTADENFIGYCIDQDPSGILVVWPTEKALRNWSTLRLEKLIEESPVLAKQFPKSGRRSPEDAIERKIFRGGYLAALSAKSTADLRSFSARRAVGEEIDEWDPDVNEQGDPIELLRARIRAFWNGKLFLISTPTRIESSRIWKELLSSTFHEYFVPCPHCDHMQTLRWRDLEDPIFGHRIAGMYRVLFEKDASGELIPGTCRYICESCTKEIGESHKNRMLERGEWRAKFPHRYPTKVGFHVNTLYSPLVTWDKFVEAFLRAVKDPTLLQVFDNTWQGLPYEERGEGVDEHFLRRRAKQFAKNTAGQLLLPRGVGLLTAGVDVQGDWLDVTIFGWGHEERAWVYRWEQLKGDPAQPEVWRQLDEMLMTAWPHEDGAQLWVTAAAIDAGYMSDRVRNFAKARARRNIVATVGRDGRGRKIIEAPGADKFKRARGRKRPMHIVGTDSAKDLLFRRLRLKLNDDGDRSTPPGYIEFSSELEPSFYEQLTAEELDTKYVNKRPVRYWKLRKGRRNEVLDTAVLNLAALYNLGTVAIAKLGEFALKVTRDGQTMRSNVAAGAPAGSGLAPPAPRGRRVLSSGIE